VPDKVAFVRSKFQIPAQFSGEPIKELLDYLWNERDLKVWIKGFTEVFNGAVIQSYGESVCAEHWCERYTIVSEYDIHFDDETDKLLAEYIIMWHLVDDSPVRRLFQELDNVCKSIDRLELSVKAYEKEVSRTKYLSLGAKIGEVLAEEAILSLLGVNLIKYGTKGIQAIKWGKRMEKVGAFAVRHAQKVSKVATALAISIGKGDSLPEIVASVAGSTWVRKRRFLLRRLDWSWQKLRWLQNKNWRARSQRQEGPRRGLTTESS